MSTFVYGVVLVTDVCFYPMLKFWFTYTYKLYCVCGCFDSQIEDGEIFATINQKDGMVRFHDNPEKYNSAAMLLELDKEVSVCVFVCVCDCVCVFYVCLHIDLWD